MRVQTAQSRGMRAHVAFAQCEAPLAQEPASGLFFINTQPILPVYWQRLRQRMHLPPHVDWLGRIPMALTSPKLKFTVQV